MELDEIIKEEELNSKETYDLLSKSFENGYLQTSGIGINNILPRTISRFTKDNSRGKKRQSVLDKLTAFFYKYYSISNKDILLEEEQENTRN